MKTTKGFTIVELMVAVLIFSMGLLSAFLLIDTAMSAATNGRNEIIAANLSREQIELLKNLRDTNWLQHMYWNSIDSNNNTVNLDMNPLTLTGIINGFYVIENNNIPSEPQAIYLKPLSPLFQWNQDASLANNNLQEAQLCKENNFYTHCNRNWQSNVPTQFYSFIQISDLKLPSDPTNIVPDAFLVTSVVISTQNGYREYVVRTILTDWKH